MMYKNSEVKAGDRQMLQAVSYSQDAFVTGCWCYGQNKDGETWAELAQESV